MKEIYINADDYNSDSIRTIQGNNNAEEYKIYLQYDNEKIDLTNKTVNLGFLRVGSTEGDIIENLNVTNPKEGEITLKITNKISKRNGTYSCQLAILGEGDFLEHTATFTLTVENNIFSDITKAIADSKDFTYLENILDKASKLSEKLKENTSSATNANNNLESNITEADNINSKLLENTSTATGLNKNLESNIDLAKEVKETIKDLDNKNIEATEKIETLTGLNAKAEELSNNINEALPVKDALVKNIELAKVANTNLLAANQEATTKNTELQASLEKTKKFIDGLDGSQNIPQLRLDVTELQNGLKSNQALSYQGSSITANNTLEGRTEDMKIKGRTLNNLYKPNNTRDDTGKYILVDTLVKNEPKDRVVYIVNNTNRILLLNVYKISGVWDSNPIIRENSISKLDLTGKKLTGFLGMYDRGWTNSETDKELLRNTCIVLDREETYMPKKYFEGLKSFGEAEKVEDKYKISVLSTGKNLFDIQKIQQGAVTNFKNENGVISGIANQYNGTTSAKISIDKKTKVLIKAKLKGCRLIINNCWLESGEFRNMIDTNNWNNNLNDFQVGQRIAYIDTNSSIRIENPHNTQVNFVAKDLCCYVIDGTENQPYELYKCYKKDILIKEPLREDDYLYEDNGQVKVYRNDFEVKLATLNFMKSSVASGTDINTIRFSAQLPNSLNSKGGKGIISNFPILSESTWDKDKENMQISGGNLYIRINKSKLTTQDVEGFKAWLKENPTTVVYQLAKPVTEVVDGVIDIDLDTYQEKTYFSIENSLPGTLDFKVPSNLGSSLQNLAKEVNNIWDVINNLLVPGILKANGNLAMIKLNNNLK
ncbi:BppU family phage baseplate upper protein [Clostridium perfringens]|uniref:BppU family phage baseplate upper protein n=1 Tax=Clostridium perfringens TaxID=1502 RepID=UPI0039EA322E